MPMTNLRTLNIVFFAALVSSIVHYTDNYLAFERFPDGGPGPQVTADAIWIAWIAFTVLGVAGYVAYRRGNIRAGAALFAVYSISGLIGLGHYSAPGMSELEWWRHAHIWADIACGTALVVFSVCSVRQVRGNHGEATV